MDARTTIEALYTAYNAHDTARVEALYAPDAVHDEIAQGRAAEGAAAIRSGLERFLEAFPDARWAPQPPIVERRRAAVAYRLTGTLQHPMGPFSPQAQLLELRGVHVFEIGADGRIARSADYWDAATFGRQMSS